MSESAPLRAPFELRRCSCGVVMEMRRHERTGFVAPINPTPTPGMPGNIVCNVDGTYRVEPSRGGSRDASLDRSLLRLNHFVTCPDREEYRRHHRALTTSGGVG